MWAPRVPAEATKNETPEGIGRRLTKEGWAQQLLVCTELSLHAKCLPGVVGRYSFFGGLRKVECGKAGLFLCPLLLSTCLLHNFLLDLRQRWSQGSEVRGQAVPLL